MKGTKKTVSLLLTAALMLSNFCIAKAESDEQIVSLQFAQDGTVTDSYNNTLTAYGSITPREITSMTGKRVVLDSKGAIEIDGQNFANSDELTFETWISINAKEKSAARRLLAIRKYIGENPPPSTAEVLYSYSSGTAVLKNRLGTKADVTEDADRWIEHSTEDIYQYADNWKHYTFTKKWDSENSIWITKTYINGVLVASSEESGSKLSEDGCKLYLGSNTTSVSGLSKGLQCSYGAFNVYKKELSAERIAQLYNLTKNNFKVPSNDMIVESVTPAEGEISCDAGKITIKFSNFIEPSTVNGNIVFSKENGGTVEGWSTSVRDDVFVDITIPKLQHRQKYKITVKPDLKSQNSISATEREIIFTAKMSGVLIDEDFMGDEFVVGQQSPEIPGIQFISGHVNYARTNIKVGKTDSGTKYLRLSPVEVRKSEAINIIFSDFSGGCPVIEYKIRIGGDDSIEPRMGMLNSTNGTYLATITNPIKISGNLVDTDLEGFASFKVIIKKNKSGYYYYEVYYTSGGEEKMQEVSFDHKMITTISLYNIIQYYQTDGAVSPENYIDISYICHYILNEPKVAESNLTTFNTESDDTVTVTFNDKIKEDSISADTVKLINKETDKVIPWNFVSYNPETKTASFKVNNAYLEYAAQYDIDCFGTQTEDGIKNAASMVSSFETPALDVTLQGSSFSKSESGISFSTTVDSEKAAEVKLIAVLYDLNLRAVQVKEETVSLTTQKSADVNILMDYPSVETGYKLKVIAVENDEGNLKPIIRMPLEYIVQ